MKKLMVALFLAGALSASAVVTINVQQVGADVQVSASGTLDTSGLSREYSNVGGAAWNAYPQSSAFRAGAAEQIDLYSGLTSSAGSFGTGSYTPATTGTGNTVYVSAGYIGLPINYITGSSLTASNTFTGESYSSLGFTPGSYTWSWSSDSITLNISASAVPEPSTYALIAGVAMLGLVVWRRRFRAAGTVES